MKQNLYVTDSAIHALPWADISCIGLMLSCTCHKAHTHSAGTGVFLGKGHFWVGWVGQEVGWPREGVKLWAAWLGPCSLLGFAPVKWQAQIQVAHQGGLRLCQGKGINMSLPHRGFRHLQTWPGYSASTLLSPLQRKLEWHPHLRNMFPALVLHSKLCKLCSWLFLLG